MFAKRLAGWLGVIMVLLLTAQGASGIEGGSDREAKPGGPTAPLTVTSLLGPEVQFTCQATGPGEDWFLPDVVYNGGHDQYLMVTHNNWSSGRAIYGSLVSRTGQWQSCFWIYDSPGKDSAQPAVAYNYINDQYLIVWMYNANGDGNTYEIWGAILSGDANSVVKSPFQIITWPNRTFWTPHVAWNSYHNKYLVVWSAFDATTFTPTDVALAVLAADGTKTYGTIISTADAPHQIDVTYNVAADEYLAVWRAMASGADGNIVGARLSGSSDAVVNPPGVFSINADAEDQRSPVVTTNEQHRYLVAWQHVYPGPCCDWDIRAQELDVAGNPVGSWFFIASSEEDETNPAVAARPGTDWEYLVAWQQSNTTGEQVWAYYRAPDGTSDTFEVASAAFWDHEDPAIAWGSPGALIAYEGDSSAPTDWRHIYGRHWAPQVVFLPLTLRGH